MPEQPVDLVTGQTLTSLDPEPSVGTVVITPEDGVWRRFDEEPRSWSCLGTTIEDSESWTRVAGNYGPVEVLIAPAVPPVDLVTALAAVVLHESYPAGSDEPEGWHGRVARAVLASGLVRPAADSVPRQVLLDLVDGWWPAGKETSSFNASAHFANELRALTEEADRA